MYIENFESFAQQAEQLYRQNPRKARYVTKYRHRDGKLVLKVTDDATCLQYKTDQQADLKKIERFNLLLFALMATGAEPSGDVEMQPSEQQQPQQRQQQQQQAQRPKKSRKG